MALLGQPSPVHHHHDKPKPQLETTTSTPAPTPSPTPPSYQPAFGALSEGQVEFYLREAGFPESVIPTMVAIEYRESHWCPNAVYGYGCNGQGHAYAGGPSCGTAQLYPCPGPQALDPAVNARYAYAKWKAAGLTPWGM